MTKNNNIKRILNCIKWLPFFVGGLLIYTSRVFDNSFTPSFRGFPITLTTRWVMTSIGLFFVIYGILSRKEITEQKHATICPNCETPFGIGLGLGCGVAEDTQQEFCPKCRVKLEPLEGFYDRHPELKESDEELSKKSEGN